MDLIEVIVTGVIAFLIGGGTLLKYRKNKSKKINIKNVTINGSGKIVTGDDNSTHISDNTI